MSGQILSQAGALNSGFPLWIFPDRKHSIWLRKLDWYLGFQIAKSYIHKHPNMAPALLELTARLELPIPKITVHPHAPLLISTESLLPNKKTIMLPFYENLSSWVSQITTIWETLSKPKLKLFLPTGINPSESQSLFLSLIPSETIVFVPDFL